MIPLIWFLIGWLLLLAIFALLALLSLTMALRFGLTGFMTYFSTTLFLGVAALIIVGAGSYFLTIDWSRSLDLFSVASPSLSP